jgi:hypothetical protein
MRRRSADKPSGKDPPIRHDDSMQSLLGYNEVPGEWSDHIPRRRGVRETPDTGPGHDRVRGEVVDVRKDARGGLAAVQAQAHLLHEWWRGWSRGRVGGPKNTAVVVAAAAANASSRGGGKTQSIINKRRNGGEEDGRSVAAAAGRQWRRYNGDGDVVTAMAMATAMAAAAAAVVAAKATAEGYG